MLANWHFPPNAGGEYYTYAGDGATAHFQAGRIRHVVRELIQNSLDAQDPGFPRVEVSIVEMSLPTHVFGGDVLASHLRECYEEAVSGEFTNSGSALEPLMRGIDLLKNDHVRCLAFFDTGTRGLSERYWKALVQSQGAVMKEGGFAHGGSFGIGKNAAFTISDLTSVVYSTRYLNGREGRVEKMQGKARLMTHPSPGSTGNSDSPHGKHYVQSVGFYCKADYSPLVGREIPEIFRLQESSGTGIFILGFNPHTDQWQREAEREVAENYFDAIRRKKLIVTISALNTGQNTIDHENIASILRQSEESASHYAFYRTISQEDARHVVEVVGPLGELSVYLDSRVGPRGLAYINRNGMLVTASSDLAVNPFAIRNRTLWTDYAAVVIPNSDDGDRWIRTMENPAHNAIQVEQLGDEHKRREAKEIFRKVRVAVRSLIDQGTDRVSSDAAENAMEMARYFAELIDQNPNSYSRAVRPSITRFPSGMFRSHGQDGLEEDPDIEAQREEQGGRGTPRDTQNRKPRAYSEPELPFSQPRIVRADSKRAMLSCTPLGDVSAPLMLSIHLRGYEPTNEEPIGIEKATMRSGDVSCEIRHDTVLVLHPRSNRRIKVLLDFDREIPAAAAFLLRGHAEEE